MGDEKSGIGAMGGGSGSSSSSSRERDRELLIPVADSVDADDSSNKPASSAASSHHHSGREVKETSNFCALDVFKVDWIIIFALGLWGILGFNLMFSVLAIQLVIGFPGSILCY